MVWYMNMKCDCLNIDFLFHNVVFFASNKVANGIKEHEQNNRREFLRFTDGFSVRSPGWNSQAEICSEIESRRSLERGKATPIPDRVLYNVDGRGRETISPMGNETGHF